jgi:hypothetical protein
MVGLNPQRSSPSTTVRNRARKALDPVQQQGGGGANGRQCCAPECAAAGLDTRLREPVPPRTRLGARHARRGVPSTRLGPGVTSLRQAQPEDARCCTGYRGRRSASARMRSCASLAPETSWRPRSSRWSRAGRPEEAAMHHGAPPGGGDLWRPSRSSPTRSCTRRRQGNRGTALGRTVLRFRSNP